MLSGRSGCSGRGRCRGAWIRRPPLGRVGEVLEPVRAHAGREGEQLLLLLRQLRGGRLAAVRQQLVADGSGRPERRRVRVDPHPGVDRDHTLAVGVGEVRHAVLAHAGRELRPVRGAHVHRDLELPALRAAVTARRLVCRPRAALRRRRRRRRGPSGGGDARDTRSTPAAATSGREQREARQPRQSR